MTLKRVYRLANEGDYPKRKIDHETTHRRVMEFFDTPREDGWSTDEGRAKLRGQIWNRPFAVAVDCDVSDALLDTEGSCICGDNPEVNETAMGLIPSLSDGLGSVDMVASLPNGHEFEKTANNSNENCFDHSSNQPWDDSTAFPPLERASMPSPWEPGLTARRPPSALANPHSQRDPSLPDARMCAVAGDAVHTLTLNGTNVMTDKSQSDRSNASENPPSSDHGDASPAHQQEGKGTPARGNDAGGPPKDGTSNRSGRKKNKPRGQPFQKGQSGNQQGRPPGAFGKKTLIARARIEDSILSIADKLVELAVAGDKSMIRLCFQQAMTPRRDGYVDIDIPRLETPTGCRAAIQRITEGSAAGQIALPDASKLIELIEKQYDLLCNLGNEAKFDDRRARLVSARLLAKYPPGDSDDEDEQREDACWHELCAERLPLKFHDDVWSAYLKDVGDAARWRRTLAGAPRRAEQGNEDENEERNEEGSQDERR